MFFLFFHISKKILQEEGIVDGVLLLSTAIERGKVDSKGLREFLVAHVAISGIQRRLFGMGLRLLEFLHPEIVIEEVGRVGLRVEGGAEINSSVEVVFAPKALRTQVQLEFQVAKIIIQLSPPLFLTIHQIGRAHV